MNTKVVSKRIKQIQTNGTKLETQIQSAVIAALEQSITHWHYTYLNDLFLALGKGQQRDALGKYILHFGNVKPNTDKTSKATKPFILDDTKAGDLAGAASVNWTEYAPAPKSVERLFDQVAIKALGV